MGITTLGVAGETVKGPAFQPIMVEDWRQFVDYFGGTNPEKFKGSQYPKYELPYIAKSYLQESNQLQVCRVLGLSGVNAGPAFIITASGGENKPKNVIVALLRSRGEHKKAAFVKEADVTNGICQDVYEYDKLVYFAKTVTIKASNELVLGNECNPNYSKGDGNLSINASNYGRFTIVVTTNEGAIKEYSVSLNPGDKNYIYNVLGGKQDNGEAEVYVEELYDVALKQAIEAGELDSIDGDVITYKDYRIAPKFEPVVDILTEDESMLTRKHVGNRYLYSKSESVNNESGSALKVHKSTDKGKTWTEVEGVPGHIYTVVAYTLSNGTRKYYYGEYDNTDVNGKPNVLTALTGTPTLKDGVIFEDCVENLGDGFYYVLQNNEVYPITLDLNNYKEQYRCATTPWIVSEVKGSAEQIELTKLFRFHTISDGDSSNTEVKISIENIDPSNGTFDVLVRDFNDTDTSIKVIEKYNGVNLIPGDKNYIALRIGSSDEQYESISKFITVEVNENDVTKVSIPSGFLGYPMRHYKGLSVETIATKPNMPKLQYNTHFDEEVRLNKQYFGMSDIVGIDSDLLSYKGVEAYIGLPESMTHCFHLDSRILNGTPDADGYIADENDSNIKQMVSVDGINGYSCTTVGKNNVTEYGVEPRIGNEDVMRDTIYENKKLRKFTLCFYGGFDGWDYYRKQRSNSDDFMYLKYRGNFNHESGVGTNFSVIRNPEAYGFEANEKCLTSDWYAYLSAIRQFANPKTLDINVLATPGIDYVNQHKLVEEVISMVEEERADSVYVVTTPDKPAGAGDGEGEMFTPDDAVWNLEDSEIDSNYTCTYYPWVKYFDADNNVYIYLPPTKDVVRNFAHTDNTKYPWFAAAGWYRGNVEAVKPKKNLKLGEQDALYDGRMNFINTFAQEGMKIWGDKNLQIEESVMNRISKRRLLLRIRKLCSIACIGFIFDPNDNTTAQSFRSSISKVMDEILANRGIVRWSLEIDDSPEARERLSLPAKIILQPQPNLEYIEIEFAITPNGSVWENK